MGGLWNGEWLQGGYQRRAGSDQGRRGGSDETELDLIPSCLFRPHPSRYPAPQSPPQQTIHSLCLAIPTRLAAACAQGLALQQTRKTGWMGGWTPWAQRAQPPDTGGRARPSVHSTALRPPTWAHQSVEPSLRCRIPPLEAEAQGQASPSARCGVRRPPAVYYASTSRDVEVRWNSLRTQGPPFKKQLGAPSPQRVPHPPHLLGCFTPTHTLHPALTLGEASFKALALTVGSHRWPSWWECSGEACRRPGAIGGAESSAAPAPVPRSGLGGPGAGRARSPERAVSCHFTRTRQGALWRASRTVRKLWRQEGGHGP